MIFFLGDIFFMKFSDNIPFFGDNSVCYRLFYQLIYIGIILYFIAPYQKKEILYASPKEKLIQSHVKHKVFAILMLFSWIFVQGSVIFVLKGRYDNAWYVIIPGLVSAIAQELLFKGLLFNI